MQTKRLLIGLTVKYAKVKNTNGKSYKEKGSQRGKCQP